MFGKRTIRQANMFILHSGFVGVSLSYRTTNKNEYARDYEDDILKKFDLCSKNFREIPEAIFYDYPYWKFYQNHAYSQNCNISHIIEHMRLNPHLRILDFNLGRITNKSYKQLYNLIMSQNLNFNDPDVKEWVYFTEILNARPKNAEEKIYYNKLSDLWFIPDDFKHPNNFYIILLYVTLGK